MILRISFYILLLAAVITAVPGKTTKDTVPTWLDTVAPIVKIQPSSKWHSTVFHISITSNKEGAVYFGLGSSKQMKPYRNPYTVIKDGPLVAYYYGEDLYGNKSPLDSVRYILDRNAPRLSISAKNGYVRKGQPIVIRTNEPCRRLLLKKQNDTTGIVLPETLTVEKMFEGFIAAIDSAGNRTVSELVSFEVDTTLLIVKVNPDGGLFNKSQTLKFSSNQPLDIFYTFDPLAPPKWFKKYTSPVPQPYGLSILRFFGRDTAGTETEVNKTKFVLDTIPPKVHLALRKGANTDTIWLSTKEKTVVRYTFDGTLPVGSSPLYKNQLIIPHIGKCILNVKARDEAGNISDPLSWECKYDSIRPIISISPSNGTYNKPFTVTISSNEQSKILYTLDRSVPDQKALLYRDGIQISRDDSTIVRAIGIDEAGNISEERSARFYLDTKPPVVKARISGILQENSFLVSLIANEPSTIYYVIGNSTPTPRSPTFQTPIPMQTGQILSYIAVDIAGNVSPVEIMDELHKPMVSAVPEGGVYNKKLHLTFTANGSASVYWREPPDTIYRQYTDTIVFNQEGSHTVEFYSEVAEGLRSALRRNEYFLDWSAPRVNVSVKKGVGDSVSIFFDASENATIYYTLDGSNPQYGNNAKLAGNKYLISKDRISIPRSQDVKLAFYAEDAAGNQSQLLVLDVFRPRAVPNIPAGPDRIYDRILSVSLNTFDQSTVYFERHGISPTTKSPIFVQPLTLMQSDTLMAFVIDASGFRGAIDTFIYLIDLPPSPFFTMSTDSNIAGTTLSFDASYCLDKETPHNKLLYSWDFEGTGSFTPRKVSFVKVSHIYEKPGIYKPTVEVIDERDRVSKYTRTIMVRERCPEGMLSVIDSAGHPFCIDRFEFPNNPGKLPVVNVSWVEAKMHCIDQGKRLCKENEWERACTGDAQTFYPYGERYNSKKCATEGKTLWKSGAFRDCNRLGVQDMLGNAWEWVETKQDDYPSLKGGSYKFGKDAHCGLRSSGTVATKANDVGFRCCK